MREIIIDTITVTEASIIDGKEGEQWEVKMNVPSIGSKYPTGPVFIPVSMVQSIKKNEQVRVKLSRGRPKKDRDGSDKEWDYWWSCVEWGTQEAPTPATSAGSNGHGNLDERISWNSAVNNAVHLYAAAEPSEAFTFQDGTFKDIYDVACRLYSIITAGPPQSMTQEAPESTETSPEPEQAPNQPAVCEIHNGAPMREVAGTGKLGHPTEQDGKRSICYGGA